MSPNSHSRRRKRTTLHLLRVLMFVFVIVLIRSHHLNCKRPVEEVSVEVDRLREYFPRAASLGDSKSARGRQVLSDGNESLGYILQTSPASDSLIGFCGPTNALIAFSSEDQIIAIDILASGDTDEHVEQVMHDPEFRKAFIGATWGEEESLRNVDAVSGATLTSRTIQQGVIARISGTQPSLKFPDPIDVASVTRVFPNAASVVRDNLLLGVWQVFDSAKSQIGVIIRTSSVAENIIGYQGPTDTLIGIDREGKIAGIFIGKSYDNEPYVGYVRDDEYFASLFTNIAATEFAASELTGKIEGVSGATMTSVAVADGILLATKRYVDELAKPVDETPSWPWSLRDAGTVAVIMAGCVIGMTRLRGDKRFRTALTVLTIVYLGLINGDMISQAMLVGWAKNSVPWKNAGGLVALSIAAFVVPITTRRNIYCTHLCPHGAAQSMLKNRLPWKLKLSKTLRLKLKCIPYVLLAWCILVAIKDLPFSLVDIEPFDAWVIGVGGFTTVAIAAVGLIGSLFVPMAYCRFGCPTGTLLNYLRFNARSDEWSQRDWLAIGLVGLAILLSIDV
ncbi:MAG: FMN-binding protein [Planctomycetales bacterium]|nr:FMN-binding protein [Planctomycetales bacterium]